MLMTGNEPNLNPATGVSGGFTGALTAIVGVGVIQFSNDCSSITGELIYNDGDIQFLSGGSGTGTKTTKAIITKSRIGPTFQKRTADRQRPAVRAGDSGSYGNGGCARRMIVPRSNSISR